MCLLLLQLNGHTTHTLGPSFPKESAGKKRHSAKGKSRALCVLFSFHSSSSFLFFISLLFLLSLFCSYRIFVSCFEVYLF